MRIERRAITRIRRRDGSSQLVMTVPKAFGGERREVVVIYDKEYMIVLPSEKLRDDSVCNLLYRILGVVARDC